LTDRSTAQHRRSLAHLVQIIDELTSCKVALVVPSQGIDTSELNPAGQLQLNILAAIAQFERVLIRERTAAGLRAAKAKGVKLGRPETLFQHQSAVAASFKDGLGVREIAPRLGLPVSSVFRLVKKARESAPEAAR
jgi:DNA invertase Pin-like site-specific DNA recombinase